MSLYLYLISQGRNNRYDSYDSVVVAAENAVAARNTYPSDYQPEGWPNPSYHPGAWVKPEDVDVKLIGTAADGVEAGVICASFNAG